MRKRANTPTDLFGHLLAALATGVGTDADRAILLGMAERTVDAVPAEELCTIVGTNTLGAPYHSKEGAFALACKTGPAGLVLRVLARMAATTGWEHDVGPYGRRGPHQANLRLLEQTDEATALALWDAALPLLEQGRLQLAQTPWQLMCRAAANGWKRLAERLALFHAHRQAAAMSTPYAWREHLQEMRKHPLAVQRSALDIVRAMAHVPDVCAPDEATWRGLDVADALLLIRLQPAWANLLHGADLPSHPVKKGDATGEERLALGRFVASAHNRLAVAGWTWHPHTLLGETAHAQRAARKILGIPAPHERRQARKAERMLARGRTPGPKGGTLRPVRPRRQAPTDPGTPHDGHPTNGA